MGNIIQVVISENIAYYVFPKNETAMLITYVKYIVYNFKNIDC